MPGNTEIPEIVIRFGLMIDVNKFVSHYGTIVLTVVEHNKKIETNLVPG